MQNRLLLCNEPDNVDDAIKYHEARVKELINIRDHGFTSINLFKQYITYKRELQKIEAYVGLNKQHQIKQNQQNDNGLRRPLDGFLKTNFEYGKRCVEYAIEHDLPIPGKVLEDSMVFIKFVNMIHQYHNNRLLKDCGDSDDVKIKIISENEVDWFNDMSIDVTNPIFIKRNE